MLFPILWARAFFFPFIVRRVLPSVQYSSVFLFRTSPIPDRIAPEQKTTKKRQLEPTALSRKRRLDRALHQRRILQTDTHTTHREGHAPHNKKKSTRKPPPPSLWAFLHRPSLVSERPSAYPSVRVSRRISNNCWIDKHFFFFFLLRLPLLQPAAFSLRWPPRGPETACNSNNNNRLGRPEKNCRFRHYGVPCFIQLHVYFTMNITTTVMMMRSGRWRKSGREPAGRIERGSKESGPHVSNHYLS